MISRHLQASLIALLAAPATAQDLYQPDLIRTISLDFQDADWWDQLKSNGAGGANILADMTVDGITYPDVGVRFKGNSSLFFVPGNKVKYSFNVEIDYVNPDQEIYGYKTLNLNNGIEDPTFCREVMYHNFISRYTPTGRANHVLLELNGESWGVYINVQQYNKDLLRDYYVNEDGPRFKCPNNPNGPGLSYLGANKGPYFGAYELRESGGLADPWQLLIDTCNTLSNEPTSNVDVIDSVFAIDAAFWEVVSENLFMDEDSYISKGADFNVYWDPLHERMHLHQHDGNESWGVSLFGWPNGTLWELSPTYNKGAQNKPVLNRLLDTGPLRQRYFAHFRTMLEYDFRPENLEPLLDEYKARLEPLVLADDKKLYGFQKFLNNFEQTVIIDVGGNSVPAPGLKEFLNGRRDYLLAHPKLDRPAPQIPAVFHVPGHPDPNDVVHVVADVRSDGAAVGEVTLWYRTTPGRYLSAPMADDGVSGDGAAGDGRYGAQLPISGGAGETVEYYVGAAADTAFAPMTFHPRRAEFTPRTLTLAFGGSGLRVTEYLYSGTDGEFVELTNTSAAPIDLTGWSLDDSSATPGTFDLSPAGILQPGSCLVITEAPPAAFASAWGLSGVKILGSNSVAKLGRNDALHVFDASGALVDRLAYGDEDYPGTHRANDVSGRACASNLGLDDIESWSPSTTGDGSGTFQSSGGDSGSPGTWIPVTCRDLGEAYCEVFPNSSGQVAVLRAEGSPLVSDNDLVLHAYGLPIGKLGYLLMSSETDRTPFFGGSEGVLCLGSPIIRFASDVLSSGSSGEVSFTVDLTSLPSGEQISPGDVRRFQFWFRDDTAGAGQTSTTSRAVEVEFE